MLKRCGLPSCCDGRVMTLGMDWDAFLHSSRRKDRRRDIDGEQRTSNRLAVVESCRNKQYIMIQISMVCKPKCTLNAIQCSLRNIVSSKELPSAFSNVQLYVIKTLTSATTSAKYVADGVKSAVARDVATPQHSRVYVTLFARAATSKTEPLVGPSL